jgi:hypothetical protein
VGLGTVQVPQGPQHAGEVVDVANQQLTHSGDSRLARHIGKAVLREEARGAQLAKGERTHLAGSTPRWPP